MTPSRVLSGALAAAGLAAAAAPAAPLRPISLEESFRLGSGGALCTAELRRTDPALSDMFDRGYSIVCRDAAAPVGRLYVLRLRGSDPAARLASLREADCQAPRRERFEDLGEVEALSCRVRGGSVGYRAYSWRRGGSLFVAEGLAGYDSALRLGLRTLAADRLVPGEIEVALTGAGDAAAFARVQAGEADPARLLSEGYRRNNAGSFAEASEFFAALEGGDIVGPGRAEALANRAIQQSNLGAYGEADSLFRDAEALGTGDPVAERMLRNYKAMDLLNRGQPAAALAALERPVAAAPAPAPGPAVDAAVSRRLNAEAAARAQAGALPPPLTPEEKARILDAQARHLRGTMLRLLGRSADARTELEAALAELEAVRGGRVVSTLWMRAQALGELAAVAEAGGDAAAAEARHRTAIGLLETAHPASPALLSAQARLAAFLARAGRAGEARTLYKAVVDANAASGNAPPALARTLAPYFALLAREGESAEAVADMFAASQLLVRPGVAQTQAVLARELSGGSDEAARLFRQSVNLAREIERLRIDAARLGDAPEAAGPKARIAALEQEQVATQAKLADFPRYRVVSGGALRLEHLREALRPGEAYYKMSFVGEDGYAMLVTPTAARAWKLGLSASALEREVDALRATISVVEEGQLLTYPFDVERAHALYFRLFGPAAADLAPVAHLIFEPDGAMLRLPPNLLVTERSGVDAYLAKARRPGSDGFDFTGVAWLGRSRDVSTSVSARAFRDVRRAGPSRARRGYIGFGENAPPQGEQVAQAAVRGLLGDGSTCTWPVRDWAKPISADELRTAGRIIGGRGGQGAEIVTGAAFTDSAIKSRADLSQYRIVHFATHGLVTAPRPECAARPALMTSFGGGDSDGLLTFSEIYDLRLDADLVILSACDTAGKASLSAMREAGLRGGGDFALDGLVRAFVGAGGRSVIASHWPVPDDYDATNRLISGLFEAPPGAATAAALRRAQAKLMAAPDTSHPYYWAGFAIVGDGAAPVRPQA